MSWQKLIKSKNDLPVLSWKAHLGLGWLSGQWPVQASAKFDGSASAERELGYMQIADLHIAKLQNCRLQNLMDQHLRRESWGICRLQQADLMV